MTGWPRAGPPLAPGKTVLYSFGLLLLTVIDLRELFSFGGRCCALGFSTAYARTGPCVSGPWECFCTRASTIAPHATADAPIKANPDSKSK